MNFLLQTVGSKGCVQRKIKRIIRTPISKKNRYGIPSPVELCIRKGDQGMGKIVRRE